MASTGRKVHQQSEGGQSGMQIKTFSPTMAEFSNFKKYIQRIESFGAAKFGIAKISAPSEWRQLLSDYTDAISGVIPNYSMQKWDLIQRGVFHLTSNRMEKNLAIKDLQTPMQNLKPGQEPLFMTLGEIEKSFWGSLTNKPYVKLYGSDVDGTLFPKNLGEWNFDKLGTILDDLKVGDSKVMGLQTPYLYYGSGGSAFAWHVEDMDLYSVSYLHWGAPKIWYTIKYKDADRFENLVKSKVPGSNCPAFLRHKSILVNPNILKENGIPCGVTMQMPGDFIVTFPQGYHSGFNSGGNIAEAVNFASEKWHRQGRMAKGCTCQDRDMIVFDPDCLRLPPQMTALKANLPEMGQSAIDKQVGWKRHHHPNKRCTKRR